MDKKQTIKTLEKKEQKSVENHCLIEQSFVDIHTHIHWKKVNIISERIEANSNTCH